MTTTRRSASLVAVLAMVLAAFAPAAFATPDDHGDTGKITLCHATSSASNPYVVITIDPAAIFKQGHDGHEGPIFDPDHHDSGDDWGDIIPPFEYSYEQGQDTVEGSYEGMNWTEEGQAILANGCELPTHDEPEDPKDPEQPTDEWGELAVTKQVTGDLAPEDARFGFAVDCGDDGAWTDVSLAAGGAWTSDELPAGIECTITETDDHDAEDVTWRMDDGGEQDGSEALVTVVADHTVSVVFTNHFGDDAAPPVAPEGDIDLDKQALDVGEDNTVVIDELGGSVDVTYRYTITNTGKVDLDLATFDDDRIGDLSDELPITSLPAGSDPILVDVTTTLTADDFDGEGDHTNVATVTTEQGPEDEAAETITLIGVGGDDLEAGISLDKDALVTPDEDGVRSVTLGEDGTVDVIYRYTVTNTGDVDLTITELADSHLGDLVGELSSTTLPAGSEPMVVEVTATLTEDDFDEGGTHTNLAWVVTEEGPDDEAAATVALVDVRDEVVTAPEEDGQPVVVVSEPEVRGLTMERAAELPRTGGDAVLGMLLAALAALGLGAGLLHMQPARPSSRRDG
jgi:hypothetical protein